jgi:hypothetical protein
MTAPLVILAVGATLARPAGACPAAAHVTVEVVARRDAVRREVLGLREIGDGVSLVGSYAGIWVTP